MHSNSWKMEGTVGRGNEQLEEGRNSWKREGTAGRGKEQLDE